jgi:YHS domain-containing protein
VRRARSFIPACILASLLAAPILAVAPVNHDRSGLALQGYDAVAYFTDGRPVPGKAEFTHPWNGATWRFASREHRDLFAAAPEKYAPQYGGYCAKAVSENNTAAIDPQAWKIVDGKLYLNYSPKVQKLWEQDIPGRIASADKNWPGLVDKD